MVRTLIVDDEPLARARIRALLEAEHDFEVVRECSDGQEAVEAIRAERPDLVILDVQMPELDGFGVVEAIGPSRLPAVIFVTGFDRFAVQAFDSQALDYILKPIDPLRFRRGLQRARQRILRESDEKLKARLQYLLAELESKPKFLERVVVRSGSRIAFVPVDEVDRMEAEGNYIRLHVGPKAYLIRETMSALEEKLDPERFVRVHRSTILNAERIKEMESVRKGEYIIVMEDGTRITSSRRYRDRLRRLLGAV